MTQLVLELVEDIGAAHKIRVACVWHENWPSFSLIRDPMQNNLLTVYCGVLVSTVPVLDRHVKE